MHSCEECSKLKQIAWSEDDEVPLSIAVGPDGQGETACPILSIVRQGVTLYKGKWGYLNKEEGTDLVVDVRITKDGVLEVDIRKHWFKILPIRIALVEFYVLPGSSPPWPTTPRPRARDRVPKRSKKASGLDSYTWGTSTRLSLEPKSSEFSEMISTWIKDCQDDHSACKSSTCPRGLPSRVIDVGSPDGKTAPRLCDTNGEPGDYIALSHCWGGRQPLVTTKDNICSMQIRIPWAELPNTFQDAITVTRMLGLKYIWIDSLCIVQDDAQDWEREAAKMAIIFEAAYVTIAATAASNGSQGLFPRERGHEFVMEGSEGEPHIFMREKCSEDCFLPRKMNTGMLSMDVETDYKVDGLLPLQKRAWCFQELILSPRVLHFTHSDVVWHCRTKWDCECGAVRFGGSYIRKLNAIMNDPTRTDDEDEFARSVQWPGISAEDPSRSWYGIVSVFTSNQITYREDILPALSGTAKKFSRLRSGRYVAGLWEDSLAHDLSWNVPMTDRSSRPTNYLGPSFSWCSCVSRIEWPNWTQDYTPRLEIVELSSTLDGTDPTGKVSSAFIKVRGLMTTAHLVLQTRRRMTSMEEILRAKDAEDLEALGLEIPENATDLAPGGPWTLTQGEILQPREGLPSDGDTMRAPQFRLDAVDDTGYASFCREKESDGSPCNCCEVEPLKRSDGTHLKDLCTEKNLVYCLRILEHESEEHKIIVALVLVPSSNTEPQTFKRIGIVYNMVGEFFTDEQVQEVTIV